MKRWFMSASALLVLIAFSPASSGAIISASGAGSIIGAPPSVAEDASGGGATNTSQEGFDERQNVLLGGADLAAVNGALAAFFAPLAAGRYHSHYIFLNTPETGPGAAATATWGFSGPIVGVISDPLGFGQAATHGILGNPGTFYPGAFPANGLEGNVMNGVGDEYSVSGNTLALTMVVGEPGDWIRVITAVPEPATATLLALALLGAGGSRRRRG